MKKMNSKLLTFALMSGMVLFASCDKNEEGSGNDLTGVLENGATLPNNITEDVKLTKDNSYTLVGGVHVKAGATLYIEEGVTITASDESGAPYILIEQGAKINAVGTASNPIVMTTENTVDGWGGIHICGKAHTNVEGGNGKSEIGNAAYGGTDESDNSGVLKYIRLEYTGYALDEEHESNGVSFYGVGNGTTVEYLQAYKGKDDGFEFFGGSVNVRNLVVTSCGDDSFDWTEGWNGKAQFLVAYQEESESCDCLMECDNNGDNNDAAPVAHPTIANITLVGNNNTEKNRGIRLREGTQVSLYNAIVTGKANALTVESDKTENALKDGTSKLEYVAISSELKSEKNIYTNADFTAGNNNLTNQSFQLTNRFVGTVDGGKDVTTIDKFFTAAAYKGAVSTDNNWTTGWTR